MCDQMYRVTGKMTRSNLWSTASFLIKASAPHWSAHVLTALSIVPVKYSVISETYGSAGSSDLEKLVEPSSKRSVTGGSECEGKNRYKIGG